MYNRVMYLGSGKMPEEKFNIDELPDSHADGHSVSTRSSVQKLPSSENLFMPVLAVKA